MKIVISNPPCREVDGSTRALRAGVRQLEVDRLQPQQTRPTARQLNRRDRNGAPVKRTEIFFEIPRDGGSRTRAFRAKHHDDIPPLWEKLLTAA